MMSRAACSRLVPTAATPAAPATRRASASARGISPPQTTGMSAPSSATIRRTSGTKVMCDPDNRLTAITSTSSATALRTTTSASVPKPRSITSTPRVVSSLASTRNPRSCPSSPSLASRTRSTRSSPPVRDVTRGRWHVASGVRAPVHSGPQGRPQLPQWFRQPRRRRP